MGHCWLEKTAMNRRVKIAVCREDLSECEEGRESSSSDVSCFHTEGRGLQTCSENKYRNYQDSTGDSRG